MAIWSVILLGTSWATTGPCLASKRELELLLFVSCASHKALKPGNRNQQKLDFETYLLLTGAKRREWMGMGVAGMIITSDCGSFPHSLSTSKYWILKDLDAGRLGFPQKAPLCCSSQGCATYVLVDLETRKTPLENLFETIECHPILGVLSCSKNKPQNNSFHCWVVFCIV